MSSVGTTIKGLKDIYYAKLLTDDAPEGETAGSATYGTPKKLGHAIKVELNPTVNTDTLYGDNMAIEAETKVRDYGIKIETTDIPLEDRAIMLGHTYDSTTGKVTVKGDDKAYIWNYIVQNQLRTLKTPKLLADNQSLINTFKDYDITVINITLSAKTLSDDFRFEGARPIEINGSVYGNLLDYPFHFLIEEITQNDQLYSIKGMFNQDELLYTQFFLPTAEIDNQEEVIPISASNHMRNIAACLNLAVDIKIDDFTPYNLSGNNRITYSDLLNSLFGWTSRLPQRQVNVFIRGGTLHCIQRGKESSVFDITDLPHSRPSINKKLIRSLWSNPKGDNENNDNPTDPHW